MNQTIQDRMTNGCHTLTDRWGDPFHVPAAPEATHLSCMNMSLAIFAGDYDAPYVGPVRRILDVGANMGAFVRFARARWGLDVEIDCYEPAAHCWPYLEANHPEEEIAAGVGAPGYERATARVPSPRVRVHRVAVTVDPAPILEVRDDWGSVNTYKAAAGVRVPALHPRELPAADVLKVDAEGVEPEIFEHYPHLGGVKIAIFEWHCDEHHKALDVLCRAAGLGQHRAVGIPGQGVAVWVRR
jgi:FkbM family methyltransferase